MCVCVCVRARALYRERCSQLVSVRGMLRTVFVCHLAQQLPPLGGTFCAVALNPKLGGST